MQNSIVPLPVPWQIETGESYLAFEFSEQGGAHLKFAARLLIDGEQYPATLFAIERVLTNDLKRECQYSGAARLVGVALSVTFKGGVWTKIHPLELSAASQSIFGFDTSRIDEIFRPFTLVEDIELWKRNERKMLCNWLTSGICPMPYAFEVHESGWLAEVKTALKQAGLPEQPIHHYLFRGTDLLVEVIAEGYEWEVDWRWD